MRMTHFILTTVSVKSQHLPKLVCECWRHWRCCHY